MRARAVGALAAFCLASAAALAQPVSVVNVAGQDFNGVRPPGPVGDVGPNHYVQAINGPGGSTLAIYTKSGTLISGPIAMDALATAAPCTSGLGYPSVLWDPLADRWVLSEYSASGDRLCVYVSQTPDPTGAWFAYSFEAPAFPNLPTLAVWPDAYVVTTDESGPAVYALERAPMLQGGVPDTIRFTAPDLAGFPNDSLAPADLDGMTPPPAGSPAFLLRHLDDEAHDPANASPFADFLQLYELRADFATPALSFALVQSIPVAEFSSNLCGLVSAACIPQPGAATLLDPLREGVLNLVYRNFGLHESLVGSFVTNVDLSGATTRAAVRWFELRRSFGDPWSLHQEGTHSPDATHRWVPAIAMNGAGDIAVGYSASGALAFPGLRWAGRVRLAPAGLLGDEVAITNGGAAQTSSSRWGDRFAMSVDPADDCTFWFTGETLPAASWATRIAAFRIRPCPEPGGAALAGLLTLGAIASRARAATRCAARDRRAPAPAAARRRAAPPLRDPRS
jgi:hypothetical protein